MAGMRIEVPGFLQSDFRTLFRYSQNLRARHGPGTRRHVKFNTHERLLYLNVRLLEDGRLSRVSLAMAGRGLQARDIADENTLERRLDKGGPARFGRPRSASDNSAPSVPAPTTAWTGRRSESV